VRRGFEHLAIELSRAPGDRKPPEHLVVGITFTPARFAGSRQFRSLLPEYRARE